MTAVGHWLLKSDAASYTIDDLKRDRTTCWEGVRNYQARNLMRDEMKRGDKVLFYHSGCELDTGPGIAGLARIASSTAYVDHHALDPNTCDYDPKATKEKNPWLMVDVEFMQKFKQFIPLASLRSEKRLDGMPLLRPGQRLSVQPVSRSHFDIIVSMGGG